MQLKASLDRAGVSCGFIACGAGSKMFSEKFRLGTPWEGGVFLDSGYASHKAIGLIRFSTWQGIKRFFSPKAMALGKRLFSRFKKADMQGDGFQSGGVFLVGPGATSPVLYKFLESDEGVEANADVFAIYREITGNVLTKEEFEAAGEDLEGKKDDKIKKDSRVSLGSVSEAAVVASPTASLTSSSPVSPMDVTTPPVSSSALSASPSTEFNV